MRTRHLSGVRSKKTAACADQTEAELSPRPERDIEGLAGTPNIVETIFRRIAACSVFVADVSFVAATGGGKKIPNPNVLLELGFAVRSIGWERTILVFNNAFGTQTELPFDIAQHRWPIEYRVTTHTEVRDKRFNELSDALTYAIKDCQLFALNRAKEMARALDTACLAVVATHENEVEIPMPMPAKTVGETLVEIQTTAAIRRLLDLGAIQVISEPTIAYGWTHDGWRMIEEVKKLHPNLLQVIRQHLG